ncbi:hypothetical protein Pan258_39070 [Symmachiella dynata]|uniref:hypothetical protein n=1 Tax=Symmachiella dynata TaxID=2527995 RepID=UPI001189A1AF|nr:hypothetical protein [Symmachiella dynata]QDT49852.1 hypothetical protein Pan258_39070 [Symmachiella dynata]
MGSDAFVVFYGICETVTVDDDQQLEMLELETHSLIQSSKQAGLDSWWGRLTEGSDYHVFVGKQIGVFGIEGDLESSTESAELLQIINDVQATLTSHGIRGIPSLHCQVEAQY